MPAQPHTVQVGEERVIVPIRDALTNKKPATVGRGTRETWTHQVSAVHTTSQQVERRGVIVPNQVYASPKPATGGEGREERDIDQNQVYALAHTTTGWRGESHRANQLYAYHNQLTSGEMMRDIDQSRGMRSPPPQIQVERRRS